MNEEQLKEARLTVRNLIDALNSKDGYYLLVTTKGGKHDICVERKGNERDLSHAIIASAAALAHYYSVEECKKVIKALKTLIAREEKKAKEKEIEV